MGATNGTQGTGAGNPDNVPESSCERCPMWQKDEFGNYHCTTHYCIENPLSESWARADEEMDSELAYRDAERESMYEGDY